MSIDQIDYAKSWLGIKAADLILIFDAPNIE
jgi:hypothetical protein